MFDSMLTFYFVFFAWLQNKLKKPRKKQTPDIGPLKQAECKYLNILDLCKSKTPNIKKVLNNNKAQFFADLPFTRNISMRIRVALVWAQIVCEIKQMRLCTLDIEGKC